MLVVRIADTDPAKLDARQTWLAAHQAHLRSGVVDIRQSDPLFAGEVQRGALLIAEVEDLETFLRLSDADPFVIHGSIIAWTCCAGPARSAD